MFASLAVCRATASVAPTPARSRLLARSRRRRAPGLLGAAPLETRDGSPSAKLLSMRPNSFEPSLPDRPWPIGEHFINLPAPHGRQEAQWVSLKLGTAEWYLDTLRALDRAVGDLDRLMGVEMAMDGVLGGISSAFDATTAALIEVMEHPLPTPSKTPEHRYSWERCKAVASSAGLPLSCEAVVDASLNGQSDTVPTGWLATVRRLRNRSTHRTTLNRHFVRGIVENLQAGTSSGSSDPTNIRLPDGTNVEPVAWCADRLSDVAALTNAMCADLDAIMKAQGR